MPKIKPQCMKSLHTIDLQAQNITPKIMTILYMDLAGKGTGEIAQEMRMTPARISVIKGSPLYIQQREVEAKKLREKFLDKQTDKLTIDPVKEVFKKHAVAAANTQVDIMLEGKSEFAKLQAADKILENAGYKMEVEHRPPEIKLETTIINRFEKVLQNANKRFSINA